MLVRELDALDGRYQIDGAAVLMSGDVAGEVAEKLLFSSSNPKAGDQVELGSEGKGKILKIESGLNHHFTYEIEGDAVTITGCYNRALVSLIIPATIEGKPVTGIGYGAFVECSNLLAVTFLGDAPEVGGEDVFDDETTPTIYRKPDAKGWGKTWGGRPV